MMIPVEQAKAQLDALIDRSNAGEEVLLTRGGRPVARMVAVGTNDAGSASNGDGNGTSDAGHGTVGVAPPPSLPCPLPNGPPSGPEPRRLGWAKGLIHVADDFDAPLEEFREYME